MRTEAETTQQPWSFLAWALHCWVLQRICMHPAAPKSPELVSLPSAIPARLGAAPPIYIPFLSPSWMSQEWLHMACAALSSAVQRGPHLLSCAAAPLGSLCQVNIWVSGGFYSAVSTRGKLGISVTMWALLKCLTATSADMKGQSRRQWEIGSGVFKWLEAAPEDYVVCKKGPRGRKSHHCFGTSSVHDTAVKDELFLPLPKLLEEFFLTWLKGHLGGFVQEFQSIFFQVQGLPTLLVSAIWKAFRYYYLQFRPVNVFANEFQEEKNYCLKKLLSKEILKWERWFTSSTE